jgi:Protein of unknown function (DUF4019)/Protein of unknown function (DUF3887)
MNKDKEQKAARAGQFLFSLHSSLIPHPSSLLFLLALFGAFVLAACNPDPRQSGMPPLAQERIDEVAEDIDEGRYEKIYNEAADEWKRTTTLEESNAIFNRLKTNLGNVKGRTYQTARAEQSTRDHLLVVRYHTTFERGEGMETFTLVERDGRWLLAKYFVNSDALK